MNNPIKCPLKAAAEISPQQVAILREGLTLTYSDFDQCVESTVQLLREKGFKEGDRIAIFLQSDWFYPVFLMAFVRMGILACPLSTRLPKEALMAQLGIIQCSHMLANIKEGIPQKKLGDIDLYHPDFLLPDGLPEAPLNTVQQLPGNRDATILFTSGSTGVPKAALHTLANHYYSAEASNVNIRIGSGDRWLTNLPLYHVSGLSIVFRCILGGAGMVFPMQSDSLEDSILLHHITHCSLVPTQLQRFLDAKPDAKTIAQLKAVLVGGAPLSTRLYQQAIQMKLPIYPTYGLTEMASQVTTARPDSNPAQRATSGYPLRFHDVKIDADQEILVRGKTLFRGYLKGDTLEEPFDKDGWYHTGDLGSLSDDGYLQVIGRKDNMFISGGENVHPEEIEKLLAEVPGIAASLVVPVKDAEFGCRPAAFIRTASSLKLNPDTISKALQGQLPGYKVPTHYFPWPEEFAEDLKPSRLTFQELAESAITGR